MGKADFPAPSAGAMFDGDRAAGGRRQAHRTKTVYRLVKVACDGDEGLARCRNISDGGMKLNVSIPLDINDRVTVTLSTTDLNGRVIWVNGKDCGIAFDEPVDCARLLNDASPELAVNPSRAPRLNTNLPATIDVFGETSKAVIGDISVRGMKIANDSNFHPGLKVRVILDNGYERDGVVRWSRDNIAGVMLLEPFSVDDLGSVQRLSRRPARPDDTAGTGAARETR